MFLAHKMQPPAFETLAWIPSLISSSWVLQRPHLVEKRWPRALDLLFH